MNEKKQTAVQWLVDKLIKGEFINSTDELVEQALEMEREQIESAYLTGLIYPNEIEPSEQAEQYFTDTYQTNER